MKLITEMLETDVEFITEAKEDGGKNYFIEGIFMQGEIKNRNGRKYPIQTLLKEVNRFIFFSFNLFSVRRQRPYKNTIKISFLIK